MLRYILFVFGVLMMACTNSEPTASLDLEGDNLEDAVIQQIWDFRNKRETKSILPFLGVDEPAYRYTAVMALASIQDTSTNTINDLASLLNDNNPMVQQAAAYALGQTRNFKATKHLLAAFKEIEQLGRDTSRVIEATILEAVGKCGSREELQALTAISYPIADSLYPLLEGQARGIYNFALRGMAYEATTRKVVFDFVVNPLVPEATRFIGANYLARARDIKLDEFESSLIERVNGEENNDILMFLVVGVAKIKTMKVFNALKKKYISNDDYRVRSNIIRSLAGYNYDSTRVLVTQALQDTSIAVRRVAADYFLENGQSKDALYYNNLAKQNPYWEVSTVLHAAAIKHFPSFKAQSKQYISQSLKAVYKETTNEYHKAAILRALGEYGWNYAFIGQQVFPKTDTGVAPMTSPVVKSTATEAFLSLYHRKKTRIDLGLSNNRVYKEMNEILLKRAFLSQDPAVLAVLAVDIDKHTELYAKISMDPKVLQNAEMRLSKPKDVETAILLRKAYSKLAGTRYLAPQPSKDNYGGIDWQQINLFKKQPFVNVLTNRGGFTLKLFPDKAPATVTQFLGITKAGFYKNKVFHRVVPNFVAQTGCPRGDGWGGFDLLVRSEFSQLNYDSEGWVGMASAGKDTEGTQFFITHSPTIHLDGRYTIFGKVEKGMDIVHQLSVGDTIRSIELVR
ncbi:MAG: peptidylprolyl isomerase [Saprospiraceae bacterium]|nr:peptidylprolyl isomerase [Saprospiraceae bacterium]